MARILFAGESWLIHTMESKGFDVFTFDRYEEATEYIRAAVEAAGHEFVHLPAHMVDQSFPKTAAELAEYDVVMFSDVGANTFNLPMNTFMNLKPMPDRLGMVADFVRAGGAFVMIGGYLTFQGIQARGCYKNSVIEELLPVELLSGDDRVERSAGVTPRVCNADHPVASGLPAEWPAVLGLNRLIPKPDAEVVAEADGLPLLALGRYGEGRSCAWATDCAPHWAPLEFCQSELYKKIWANILAWLTKKI